MFIRSLLLVTTVLVLGDSIGTSEEPPKVVGFGAGPPDADGDQNYFRRHLSKCPENELRCLWFNDGVTSIGQTMTFDLDRAIVRDASVAPSWGSQGSPARKLTHHQVIVVRETLASLPKADPKVSFAGALHLAFWSDGKLKILDYPVGTVPLSVRRLFDIGGIDSSVKYEK